MRILHTADWQLGALPGIPGSQERQDEALAELLEIAIRERVDAIVAVGDLFEHGHPTAQVKDRLIHHVNQADLAGVRYILMLGNHDYEDRALSGYHPLVTLKLLRDRFLHVDVWDELIVVEYPTFVLATIPPALNSAEVLDPRSWPNQHLLQSKKPLVVTMHACLQGAQFANGEVAKGGFSPYLLAQTGATYVALGDVHKRQQVNTGPNGPRAHYCGSLVPKDFGEKADESGVLLVWDDPSVGVTVKPIQLTSPRSLHAVHTRPAGVVRTVGDLPTHSISRVHVYGPPEEIREIDFIGLRESAKHRDIHLLFERHLESSQVKLSVEQAATVAEAIGTSPEEDLKGLIQESSFSVDSDALTLEGLRVLEQARISEQTRTAP